MIPGQTTQDILWDPIVNSRNRGSSSGPRSPKGRRKPSRETSACGVSSTDHPKNETPIWHGRERDTGSQFSRTDCAQGGQPRAPKRYTRSVTSVSGCIPREQFRFRRRAEYVHAHNPRPPNARPSPTIDRRAYDEMFRASGPLDALPESLHATLNLPSMNSSL